MPLFRSTVELIFGDGESASLRAHLAERGFTRPLVVVDAAVQGQAAVKQTIDALGGACAGVISVNCASEPSYDYLDECTAQARPIAGDCLVGIGGGSAMDLCKGIAVLLRNPGKGVEYRGMDKVTNANLPTILLPTTAGTGSEATFTAVFVDQSTNTKMGINGRHVMARLAILDPSLTAKCPRVVAVGAGLDAMVHSLEAFMTTRNHPVARLIAEDAFCRLFRNFPSAVNNPDAMQARLQMLIGSHLAGLTLMYSGGGIAGALSYPLGGTFHVPHGLAGGLLLQFIIRENIDGGYYDYAELHDRIFPSDASLSAATRSQRFLRAFQEMLKAIHAPADFGNSIGATHLPEVVTQTLTQRSVVLANNPVKVDNGMLERILSGAIRQ